MVSVIVCTMRESCLENIFANFERQRFDKKEMIIVLTKKEMNLDRWKEEAKRHQQITVFQVDNNPSLGECLNYAIYHANYDLIANFDDDDYYSSDYLDVAISDLNDKKADVLGKTTVYIYFQDRRVLGIFNSNNEHQYVNEQTSLGKRYLSGATLVFKRAVITKVSFRDQTEEVDRVFCEDCMKNGYELYSGGKENFVYVRKDIEKNHTWKVRNDIILNTCEALVQADDFRPYINQREERL